MRATMVVAATSQSSETTGPATWKQAPSARERSGCTRSVIKKEGAERPRLPLSKTAWEARSQLIFDRVHAGEHAFLHVRGQRGVIERRRHFFALAVGPAEEFHELLAIGRVLLVLINQQPGGAGDRISLSPRRVHHGKSEVVRDLRGGQCGRHGI